VIGVIDCFLEGLVAAIYIYIYIYIYIKNNCLGEFMICVYLSL
jgi:hypothetical protein